MVRTVSKGRQGRSAMTEHATERPAAARTQRSGRPTRGARTTPYSLMASLAVFSLLAAGCGSFGRDNDPANPDRASAAVRLYGSDGNMINNFGAAFKDQPGLLNGMKGTTPLAPVADDFKKRLRSIDPGLQDYNYAGEAYDA